MRLIDADALEERMVQRLVSLRKEYGNYDHYTDGFDDACLYVEYAKTIDAVPLGAVAKMFYDFTGDSCACDFNGNDEWLSEVCELQNECPYPKDKLGCWKQYIKHFGERKE